MPNNGAHNDEYTTCRSNQQIEGGAAFAGSIAPTPRARPFAYEIITERDERSVPAPIGYGP
jgi:hypothetical protein